MIALAAALIGAGILASAALYHRADHQVPVLMVTTPVPAGSVITAKDVGTTTVAGAQGVHVIPARQLSQVVGLVAATALRPGTLLAPSELTSKLSPGPGQELVPVRGQAVGPARQRPGARGPGARGGDPGHRREQRVRGRAGAEPADSRGGRGRGHRGRPGRV